MPRVAASHVPCAASYTTTGSLARSAGPGRGDESVRPGSRPAFQVAPPSREVAKPMATAPPSKTRPTWTTATTVEPKANVSGSACVACWPIGSLVRSAETCRDTTSQSRWTRSEASAVTMSRPGPQATRSRVPSPCAGTRSSPLPAAIVSRPGPPRITSAPVSPRSVSFPPRPSRTSARAVPLRLSAPGVPVTVAADARPASSALAARAAARRSMALKVAGRRQGTGSQWTVPWPEGRRG